MTTKIGSLEIDVAANLARLKTGMDQAERQIVGGMTSIVSGARAAGMSVGGAFAVVTAGATAAVLAVHALSEEWDELGKSAQRVGFQSAQSFAEYQYAARLAGVETASLETAVGKLSNKMTEARGGNKEAVALFRQLGVEIKGTNGELRSTEAVLADVAQTFSGWADGPEKSAWAVELFGKAGRELIPMLNAGAAGLAKTREEFRALRGELSQDSVRAAEQFNDNLTKLQTSARGLATELTAKLLPALNEVTDKMVEAGKRGGFLAALWEGIVAGTRIATATDDLAIARRRAGALGGEIERLSGEVSSQQQVVDRDPENTMAVRRLNSLKTKLQQVQQEALRATETVKLLVNPAYDVDPSYTALENKRLAGHGPKTPPPPGGGAAKESEYDKINRATRERIVLLDAELSKGRELTEFEKYELKAKQDLEQAVKKQTGATRDTVNASLAELEQKEQLVQVQRAEFKEAMAIAQERQRQRNADYEAVQKYTAAEREAVNVRLGAGREMLEQIEFETRLLSMNTTERDVALAMRQLEAKGIKEGTAEWEAYAEAIRKAILDRSAVQQQTDAFKSFWESVDSTGREVFTSLEQGNTDLWKRMRNTAKATFFDWLYEMTLRPFLFKVAVQASGVSPGVARSVGSQVFGGGNGMMGGLSPFGGSMFPTDFSLSSVANTLGFTNVAAGMSGVGGSFASTVGGGLATDAMGATVLADSAAASIGSFGATLGAAMPWIAAAVAVASLLSGKFKGETRVGGQYRGTTVVDGPSGGQISGAITAIGATMASITGTLKAMGSTATLATLVSGLEQSERGKGFAYAGGALRSAGGELITFGQGLDGQGYMNRRGNMSNEQAMAALAEELMQVRLEVIQASDATGELADWVRGLGDISEYTGERLQAVISRLDKALTEKAALEEQIYQLTTSPQQQLVRQREREMEAVDETNRELQRRVHQLQDEAAAMAEANRLQSIYFENFLTDEEKRLRVAQQISQQLSAAGLSYSPEQIVNATRAQFRALAESMDANSPARKALMGVMEMFVAITPPLESAAERVDDFTDAVKQTSATIDGKFDALYGQYVDSLRATGDELRDVINQQTDYVRALKQFRNELTRGALARLTPEEQYVATKAEFERLAALPTMDKDRMANITAAGQAFLQASQVRNASSAAYAMDRSMVLGVIEASETAALSSLNTNQQLLAVNQQQLAALGAIQSNTLTTVQALGKLTEAIILAFKSGNLSNVSNTAIIGALTAVGGGMAAFTADPTKSDADKLDAELTAYYAAKQAGLTLEQAAAKAGYTPETLQAWLAKNNLPSYDVGTPSVSRTGLAMVHRGERILTAIDNNNLSGAVTALQAEMRAVRAAVERNTTVNATGFRDTVGKTAEVARHTAAAAKSAALRSAEAPV
jgi:hypothetical protein